MNKVRIIGGTIKQNVISGTGNYIIVTRAHWTRGQARAMGKRADLLAFNGNKQTRERKGCQSTPYSGAKTWSLSVPSD